MDLIMKNLKNGLKKNCKILLIICLLLVSFCIYKKSENITLFEKITNQYELNKIENKTDIKTFYFYKNDCNICKKYKKNINKLVKKGIEIYGIDLSNDKINKIEVINQYNLNEIPTLIVLKNKKVLTKIEGYKEYGFISKKIFNIMQHS